MANCPHCAKELGSGYLDEETHKARLKAKEDRNKALEEEIKASREKAAGYDAAVRERDEAKAKLEAAETKGVRAVALAQSGIVDPAASKRVEAIYALYREETGEEAQEFASWLSGPAREDVLLAPLFAGKGSGGAAAGAPGKSDAGKGAAKPNPLPNANAGAKDAGPPPGRLTETQVGKLYADYADQLRRSEPDPKKRQAALEAKRAELAAAMAPKAA